MPTSIYELVIDAIDHRAQAKFYGELLELRVTDSSEDDTSIGPVDGENFVILFDRVTEPKVSKNRLHFDLSSTDEADQQATVRRALDLGATRADIGQPADAPWTVMRDPEGNEFCVLGPSRYFDDTGRIGAIACDAADHHVLGRFWSEATGWPIVIENDVHISLKAPGGPYLTMGPPVAAKTQKNRIHIDVAPAPGSTQDDEVERLIGLGASRLDIGQGDVSWVVMADPEGNEFCVLRGN